MKQFIPVILLLITFTTNLQAQKPPRKFGKINTKDFDITMCPIDKNAHAYYIFDYGRSYFQYAERVIRSDESGQKGFQLYFTRHFRIKIVDSKGFDWSNITIPLYRSNDGTEEKILKLRAYTYNLEEGKIVKTKLERKDINLEETNKHWLQNKFALPNIKEGSIIEVEYSVLSDFFFNLQKWQVQYTIPVLQSEYHVRIPEYYNYNQTQKGYYPISTESTSEYREFELTYHQKAEGMSVKEYKSTQTIRYREDIFHYYASDIPALTEEKYLRTLKNYLTEIDFELQSIKFPSSPMKLYNTSWEKIVFNLLKNPYFGRELKGSMHLRKDIETLQASGKQGLDLVNDAFNLIKQKIVWNNIQSKYVDESLGRAYRQGTGNSADINLNLVLLLRELGFQTHPVVLSTQHNGIIHPAHPSVSTLNYVIAATLIDGKYYLMDASDPFSEINILPIRCLNDKGLVVRGKGDEWIDLMGYRPYQMKETYNVTLNEDLSLNGTNSMRFKDYAAYLKRKAIKNYNSIEEYTQSVEKKYQDLKFENYTCSGIDTLQEQVEITCDFTHQKQASRTGDLIMFSPAYEAFNNENPFKIEKREYPVEFNYPYTVQQIYAIKLPEGYTIEDLPKPMIVQTPDKSAKYMYNVTQMKNKVTLTILFSQKKMVYLPDEYSMLKAFYQMIIDKQEELIVLKKE